MTYEKRILLVDDEADHLATVAAFLRDRGFTISTASNGEEAVKKVFEVKPHLIVMDIMMPVMDGTDAASVLREDPRTRRIPVIFLTAVVDKSDQRTVSDNPNLILAKPVKLEDLLRAINQAATLQN